jgi:N-acetyl-gamma-glutamyl-phosphate reductase
MNDPQRVAVVGATGYAGFELARLLLRHPGIAKPTFYLRESAKPVNCLTEIFPQLRGWGEAPCRPFSVEAIAASGASVAFLATPHEASLEMVPALLKAGLRVVDLSGAFRFRNPETFAHWYKLPAPDAALLSEAVYGLPELYGKELAQARLVANPGCYPTSVILGLRPLIEAGWIARERGIVCDCKSGATGAGKEPKRELHFVEVDENFKAYGLFTHRHTPEVTEHLGLAGSEVMFSTHLLPLARGILSTLYVWLGERREATEVESLYRRFYAEKPMVRLWQAGRLPELQHVAHTNFCDIGFALDSQGERLVIVSCLDNLGKGAAGQAVQNMNGMMGFQEAVGLQ